MPELNAAALSFPPHWPWCGTPPWIPGWPPYVPPRLPSPLTIDPATRTLSPSDFGAPNASPVAAAVAAGNDDLPLAVILANLKAGLAQLGSSNPSEQLEGRVQIAMTTGYLIGALEARGASVPAVAAYGPDKSLTEATTALVSAIEQSLAQPTRIIAILVAITAIAYRACKGG